MGPRILCSKDKKSQNDTKVRKEKKKPTGLTSALNKEGGSKH